MICLLIITTYYDIIQSPNEREVKQMNNDNPLYDLAEMLKNAEIPYELAYNPFTNSNILCYPNKKERIADAIYFWGSYGYEQGLLEVGGKIVEIDDDEVEGYVPTEEAFRRIKKLWESDNK